MIFLSTSQMKWNTLNRLGKFSKDSAKMAYILEQIGVNSTLIL